MRAAVRAVVVVLIAACCWSLTPRDAAGAQPALGGVSPFGGQRGTEVEVALNGARLGDAQELMLYYPGISVATLQVVNDNQVKVRLKIAPDCRLGVHALRVRTRTGVSDLRLFSVGALPETPEVEPNNDFAQPQKIALGTTVNGVAENEDVDYYVVEAKQGERICAEIEGIRLGNAFFDPYVAIMDAGRFVLASSDDSALARQDAVCSIVAPKDGAYIIQARETSFAGNGGCVYRLHVGKFPRPTVALPAGGKPGETLDVRWLGDPMGEKVEKVTLPMQADPKFGVFAQDPSGISPSATPFRLTDLANTLETEPNNELAQGTPAEAPRALAGVIAQPGDVDCFKFAAKKGQVFDVRVLARQIGSPLDSVVNVYRVGGQGIGGNDDNGGPDSYYRFQAPEDDAYVVRVTDHLGKGGPTYGYRIEVTLVKPQLTTGLPERQQYVDTTVSVPKGNRTAFLVSAGRADFGGDLNVTIPALPGGVTLETVPMAANQSIVPVLLTAAADAPLAGSLTDIVARHVDPKTGIEGHFSQTSQLVRGQNNILVYGHTADRAALAVTEEVPFTIDVVEPKVPIVRNGQMGLKIVATRKEGYKTAIGVRMLYNPPGIGSPGSVAIPEGQNEVVLPLTADGGAEIRAWKIAILAEAAVGNGAVLVSSKLITLTVSEPYVGFAFQAAAVEQNKETDLVVKVAKAKDWEGPAKVELLGLPNEVTTSVVDMTKTSAELVYHLKTTANSPAGKHKTLLCRATIMENGEPIVHMLGGGELRIDTPLPPKPNAAPPMPMPMPAPMPAAAPMKPPEKRLSRLEQLRLDREKEKQAGSAPAAPAKTGAPPAPAPAAPTPQK